MAQTVPAEVFPPGEIIREELEERGWNQLDLAEILGRPLTLVNEILTGKRAITPETAKGLGDAFGVDAQFFLNLESAYQLWKVAKGKTGDGAVARRADLYAKAPVRELVRRRYVERSESVDVLEGRILSFYGVNTFSETPKLWPVAARVKSPEFDWTHWAWLVRARRLAPAVHVSAPFSDAKFQEAVGRLRLLFHSPEETRHVPRILSDAGIRLVVVEHFPQTKWDGATFWLDQKSPVVALSLRYDRVDYFWHTLLHELWHIQKRHGLKDEVLPVDEDIFGEHSRRAGRSAAEQEVDTLAAETLIPTDELERFIIRTRPLYGKLKIRTFAGRLKVHPGIVVGQLQHRGEIGWTHSREMLAKIRQHVFAAALTDGWGNYIPLTA
jgi:HTH-type transcriptional regulator/antitoxin HigA